MDSEKRQQLELLPAKTGPHVAPVTAGLIEHIRNKRTFLAAWKYAQDFADLEHKEVYEPLGIDSSHWTKIRNGQASPPGDERFDKYLDVVKNEIPLIWWVERRGYNWLTLQKHQSELEKENAELRNENAFYKRVFNETFGRGK